MKNSKSWSKKSPKPQVSWEKDSAKKWSSYQSNFFDKLQSSNCNIALNAIAGSGKSTSLSEGIKYLSDRQNIKFCAFGADAAKEMRNKIPDGVESLTIHALGRRAMVESLKAKGKSLPDVDEDKGFKISASLVGDDSPEKEELIMELTNAAALATTYNIQDASELNEIYERHEVYTCGYTEDEFSSLVMQHMNVREMAWKASCQYDFNDMIWIPIKLGLLTRNINTLVIDECQDLSPARIAFLKQIAENRVIAAGDPNQAIFMFAGADSQAFSKVIDEFSATEMPLSVTYRCDKAIVDHVKDLVPYIESAPNAGDGTINYTDYQDMMENVKDGDFILARVNAPLIKIAMKLVLSGKRAQVLGKDLASSFDKFVYIAEKYHGVRSVGMLLDYIDQWLAQKIEEGQQKGRKKFDFVKDKAECLRYLCEGAATLSDVSKNIKFIFSDKKDGNIITVSNTHKAKGLERDRAWLLSDTFRKCESPQTPQQQEENNLYYVAATRAKHILNIVQQ